MCMPILRRSRRQRILMALANLALAVGIASPYLIHPARTMTRNWFDATRGLLLGFSIATNLYLVRFARRCSLPSQERP